MIFRRKKIVPKEPPNLFEQTQALVRQILLQLDGDFITYWGASNSNIAGNDGVAFSEILKANGQNSDKLFLFLKSSGGSGEASLRTIHLLREHYQEVIALVPLSCASAATMLALGANEIHMGPLSYLTAVDTSVTHELSPLDADRDTVSVSQNELDRVLKLWNSESKKDDKNPYNSLYKYIHPLVFGAVDRASSLSIKLTNEILSYHMTNERKISEISNHLNSEYPSHNYPITYREAKKIGLKVQLLDKGLNQSLLDLNHLYSAMAQRCYTDYDEYKYHSNQIYTILERKDMQVFYKQDKDFVWRKEDQIWLHTNDNSSWMIRDRETTRQFYIR